MIDNEDRKNNGDTEKSNGGQKVKKRKCDNNSGDGEFLVNKFPVCFSKRSKFNFANDYDVDYYPDSNEEDDEPVNPELEPCDPPTGVNVIKRFAQFC